VIVYDCFAKSLPKLIVCGGWRSFVTKAGDGNGHWMLGVHCDAFACKV
jgi:hypothetical protein